LAFGVFCAGIAAYLTKYTIDKKNKSLKSIQGSPCYGAYPNQYSSLPTKDVSFLIIIIAYQKVSNLLSISFQVFGKQAQTAIIIQWGNCRKL
jgi:hypothetical protein